MHDPKIGVPDQNLNQFQKPLTSLCLQWAYLKSVWYESGPFLPTVPKMRHKTRLVMLVCSCGKFQLHCLLPFT